MKKLFTLVAVLASFMGAKAEVVEDYKIDYSTKTGFPFYVMGYVPEWNDGVMTDFGGKYEYANKKDEDAKTEGAKTSETIVKTQEGVEYYKIEKAEDAGVWHQYFIADGIPTELDGSYTVKAMVRASEACTFNVNMGWGWNEGQQTGAQVSVGTDWAEVEWTYTGIGGTSCNLVAQPSTTATIEWKWLTVSHNQKAQRPVEWLEQLTNGDAEKAWDDKDVRFDDQSKNFTICAWGKEVGRNTNNDGGSDPFPADIVEVDGGHAFVVHAKDCPDPSVDASAWDNQFWIQSPKSWKSGTQIQIHFRYKASQACKTNTQIHKQNPSDYLHWEAVGDVNFTTEWQEFDKTFTFNDAMSEGWSIAFNLNPDVKTATDFYFDDLSWKIMKLDEGYFVAGSNPDAGLDYDLDNAIEFKEEDGNLVATVGEKNAYVSQIMISTVRGNDAAFKGATLKPTGTIENDPETWLNYDAAGIAKLNLPGVGIWKIYLDTEDKSMAFELIEGTAKEKVIINPNPIEITVNAVERDDLSDGTNQDGTPNVREGEGGTGEAWDNQFWIFANRPLQSGESTIIEFDYVADKEAKTTTQCQAIANGSTAYLHWAAIGDVTFTTDEQHFSKNFVIPADGAKATVNINGTDYEVTNHGIAFNMAEIKEACNYTIKNIVWKLEDGSESLIDQTGNKNFWVKIGAGTNPYPLSGETGIENVVEKSANASKATFNIAGQRVSKDFKGLVIKNGGKYLVK